MNFIHTTVLRDVGEVYKYSDSSNSESLSSVSRSY